MEKNNWLRETTKNSFNLGGKSTKETIADAKVIYDEIWNKITSLKDGEYLTILTTGADRAQGFEFKAFVANVDNEIFGVDYEDGSIDESPKLDTMWSINILNDADAITEYIAETETHSTIYLKVSKLPSEMVSKDKEEISEYIGDSF